MTRATLIGAMIIVLSTAAMAADSQPSCFEAAKDQKAMNDCARAEYTDADRSLNLIYQQVLKEYETDSGFTERLKLAQRAWLMFRDAELEALFPAGDKASVYGTTFPMCFDQWRTRLANERTAQLKRWLDRVPEGDACAGSIQPRSERK